MYHAWEARKSWKRSRVEANLRKGPWKSATAATGQLLGQLHRRTSQTRCCSPRHWISNQTIDSFIEIAQVSQTNSSLLVALAHAVHASGLTLTTFSAYGPVEKRLRISSSVKDFIQISEYNEWYFLLNWTHLRGNLHSPLSYHQANLEELQCAFWTWILGEPEQTQIGYP